MIKKIIVVEVVLTESANSKRVEDILTHVATEFSKDCLSIIGVGGAWLEEIYTADTETEKLRPAEGS